MMCVEISHLSQAYSTECNSFRSIGQLQRAVPRASQSPKGHALKSHVFPSYLAMSCCPAPALKHCSLCTLMDV